MILPALSLDGEGPLYRQVYRGLRAAILERRILGGARLPSSRELADQAGVSRNTAIRAYEQAMRGDPKEFGHLAERIKRLRAE